MPTLKWHTEVELGVFPPVRHNPKGTEAQHLNHTVRAGRSGQREASSNGTTAEWQAGQHSIHISPGGGVLTHICFYSIKKNKRRKRKYLIYKLSRQQMIWSSNKCVSGEQTEVLLQHKAEHHALRACG